ncbi:MAG: radical SAM protein [Desulfobacteraceae bacterium]|jgi:radical SAM superfamily enzyme YgiQ (UPF0313 family)
MLLIYPPAAKACEPPPGIARLHGSLKHHGIPVRTIDMNLEGFYHLYRRDIKAEDLWGKRAVNKKELNLSLVCESHGYENRDRYKNAVMDINKVLAMVSKPADALVTLANYKSNTLSPLKSSDLLYAADHPEENIYYPYFKARFEQLNKEDEMLLDTVGFSLNYLNQALCTFAMIGYLKKVRKQVRIIVGGGLITSFMRKPGFESPFDGLVDVMIAGKGEHRLLELFGMGDTEPSYLPDFSDMISGPSYLSPGLVIPFCTADGCYWKKCTFCPEQAENNPYEPIAMDSAVAQVNALAENYKPALFHFVDNALSPRFMTRLFQSGFKTPWYTFSRVTGQLGDESFCRSLKQSGCRMMKLGVESGDQNVLNHLNKGIDLKVVSKSLEQLHHAGISTYVYLLFGTPWETEAAARKTMDFVRDHKHLISYLNIALFNLPYFAKGWDNLETSEFYDGDLSLYKEFNHPMGWNRSNIRSFLDKEFKRHPDISAIINRDPTVFNSNHAAFF